MNTIERTALVEHTLYRRRPTPAPSCEALIAAESCNVGSESDDAPGHFDRLIIAMNREDHGGPMPHIPPEQMVNSRPSERSQRWATRCVYLIGLITALGIWRGFVS